MDNFSFPQKLNFLDAEAYRVEAAKKATMPKLVFGNVSWVFPKKWCS